MQWVQALSFAAVSLTFAIFVARRRRDAFGWCLIAILGGNAAIAALGPLYLGQFTVRTVAFFVASLAIDAVTIVALLCLPWTLPGMKPGARWRPFIRPLLAGYLVLVAVDLVVAFTFNVRLVHGQDIGPSLRHLVTYAGWLAFGLPVWLAVAVGANRFYAAHRTAASPSAAAQFAVLGLALAIRAAMFLPTGFQNIRELQEVAFPWWHVAASLVPVAALVGGLAGLALADAMRSRSPWSWAILGGLAIGGFGGLAIWSNPETLRWMYDIEPQVLRPILLCYGVLRWRMIAVPENRAWRYVAFLAIGPALSMGASILRFAEDAHWDNPWLAAGLVATVTGLVVAPLLHTLVTRRRWSGALQLPAALQARFKPGAILKRGPMTTVASARERSTGRRVVLKFATDGNAARIDREAEAMRILAGPPVMPVLAHEPGILVLPRLPAWRPRHGGHLRKFLAHLADKGWVHGDLSPPNLYRGPRGLVVGDFSIARPVGESWGGAVGQGTAATANQLALGRARLEDDAEAARALAPKD